MNEVNDPDGRKTSRGSTKGRAPAPKSLPEGDLQNKTSDTNPLCWETGKTTSFQTRLGLHANVRCAHGTPGRDRRNLRCEGREESLWKASTFDLARGSTGCTS